MERCVLVQNLRLRRGLSALITLAVLSGCAHIAEAPCTESRCFARPPPPLIVQRHAQCGPASLASVMAFYGVPETQDSIARDMLNPGASGVPVASLTVYAMTHGFTATTSHGSFDTLRDRVRSNHPQIVFVAGERDATLGHYMVIWGYDDTRGRVFVRSGYRNLRTMPYEDFQNVWARTGMVTLDIRPVATP